MLGGSPSELLFKVVELQNELIIDHQDPFIK